MAEKDKIKRRSSSDRHVLQTKGFGNDIIPEPFLMKAMENANPLSKEKMERPASLEK
ncbi:hypothetical protein [Peribacillus sp. SI8-4]|uniref:hypothetical protein n=1 Tax=Peribacillus sp. SI8-4 TaxID=3048009 RepID=UPI002552B215|nr:hypothetical protein [Peribacillus sp. SI8-4]